MRPRAAWVVALAAGLLVWSAASELQLPARLLTAVLLGPAPVAFMMQARAVQFLPAPPPRLAIYASTMLVLWVLAILAYSAARLSGMGMRDLGLVAMQPRAFVAWTLTAMFAAFAIVLTFRYAGTRETALMRDIIPITTTEKMTFCGLSVSAGVCEELAFRGFLMTAVTVASGSTLVGVVLSSIAFGTLHAHQNPAGAARAALLGAALCIPLIVTGSIYASMAAHTLIDLAGGLWLAKWLVR